MYKTKQLLCWLFLMILSIKLLSDVSDLAHELSGYPIRILKHSRHVSQTAGPYQGTVIYVINLDRATQRLALILPNLEKLGYPIYRISAVNGHKLSREYIKKYVVAKTWQKLAMTPLYKGAIGCSLSHLKTYQTFLNSHYKYALIVEDDANFNSQQLKSTIGKLLSHKQIWDLVNFDIAPYPPQPKGFTLRTFHKPDTLLQLTNSRTWNSGGYLINRNAAAKLIETGLPVKIPLDFQIRRDWELGIISAAIYPPLIKQKFKSSYRRNSPMIEFFHPKTLTSWLMNIQGELCRSWYHLGIYLKKMSYI